MSKLVSFIPKFFSGKESDKEKATQWILASIGDFILRQKRVQEWSLEIICKNDWTIRKVMVDWKKVDINFLWKDLPKDAEIAVIEKDDGKLYLQVDKKTEQMYALENISKKLKKSKWEKLVIAENVRIWEQTWELAIW